MMTMLALNLLVSSEIRQARRVAEEVLQDARLKKDAKVENGFHGMVVC